MKAVVAERGQVTIPQALRKRMGIGPRTVLDFTEDRGRLVAMKVAERDPLQSVYGTLKLGCTTDEAIRRMRGPA